MVIYEFSKFVLFLNMHAHHSPKLQSPTFRFSSVNKQVRCHYPNTTPTTYVMYFRTQAFSWVLENKNTKFPPPASSMKAGPGDTKHSAILVSSLWKSMRGPYIYDHKKLFQGAIQGYNWIYEKPNQNVIFVEDC